MSRLVSDGLVVLLAKGFVLSLLAIGLVNLIVQFRGGNGITALSGAVLFVYASVVLTVGVFTDRLFDPRVQVALFCGLTAYWAYDYLVRENTLSIALVAFGAIVLTQQVRRLSG